MRKNILTMLTIAACTVAAGEFVPRQPDPYKAAWRFVWLNLDMLNKSDAELDALARGFAEGGTTHVMSFNGYHYIFNYYDRFDELAQFIGRLSRAFNKYGLYFTEHHSCVVFHYAIGEHADESAKNYDQQALDSMKLDSDCYGVPVGSLLQRSLTTGEPMFFEFYHNYTMCPNNPDFRRIYFAFLRKLYAAGINGMLADDIGFTDGACGCEHCRRLFHERTGLTMPPPEKWDEVMADTDSEIYLAFLLFRYNSILEARHAVAETYKEMGLNLIDPVYSAWGVAWRCPRPNVIDDYRDLTVIFQECFGGAMRYSWPEYLTDSPHRTMIGRWNNAPVMSLYYPGSDELAEFAWMLCMYSGHLFLSDSRDNTKFPDKPLREFEQKHSDLLFHLRSAARLAIYDSSLNRNLDLNFSSISGEIGEMMIFENVPFDYVGLRDFTEGDISGYELLIVPEVRFLSDEELNLFRSFAERGGKILWLGESGSRTYSHFGRRSVEELHKALNAENNPIEFLPVSEFTTRFIPRAMAWSKPLPSADWQRPTPDEISRRKAIAAKLKALLSGPDDISADVPENLLISSLHNPDNGQWTMHLLNAVGSLDIPAGAAEYNMTDPLPYPDTAAFSVTLRKPFDRAVSTADAYSLDGEPIALPVRDNGATVTVTVPANALKRHLAVDLK